MHETWPPNRHQPLHPNPTGECSLWPPENRQRPLSVCTPHIYLQASPSQAPHSLAAYGHPGRCFLHCVHSFIKGNDPRSSKTCLLSQRETHVACPESRHGMGHQTWDGSATGHLGPAPEQRDLIFNLLSPLLKV